MTGLFVAVGIVFTFFVHVILKEIDRRQPVMGQKARKGERRRCVNCNEPLEDQIVMIGANRCYDCQEQFIRDTGRHNGTGGRK